jgi:dipeptidyl aminopeptidase/acylaminoacyl peptidase
MDLDDDRYVRRIWLWDGTAARPLTAGPGDSSPRWSPDGTRLAFLRKPDADSGAQVAVLWIDGGEAEIITEFGVGASELAWAPDGSRLAVVAAEWTDDFASLDADERPRQIRRITRLPYRSDHQGWTHDRRSHVYLLDPTGDGEAVCLTPGEFDEAEVVWHPSRDELAFCSARHPERGLDDGYQLWTVAAAADSEPIARTDVGAWGEPSYDRRGNLYVIGRPDRWAYPDSFPLNRIDDDGTIIPLTDALDRNLTTLAPPLSPGGPQWLDHGGAFSTVEDSGRVRVIRVAADGTTEDLLGGDRLILGVSPRPDGSAFAFVATSAIDPGELWWWEDGEERCLTSLNEEFRDDVTLAAPERFVIEHEGIEVEGWVYLPTGDDPVPVLFNIHGGPATQYGYGFFDEFQVYVGAGYGIVAINPRGSSGYGAEFVRAVLATMFEPEPPDVRDYNAAVDTAAAEHPRLDTSRVGVMGGSYGGLMSARLIGMTDRYRSAVAERGVYNFVSFSGTSDIGPWFSRIYLDAAIPEGAEAMWAASPLSLADKVTTPTLVIHSESDFRTPIEQAEQYFAALLAAGVETELVRFPAGQSHELSRSGSPRLRRERFELILEWHNRHLR